MSEVELLYKNAGVEKDCRTYKNYFECPFKQTQCEQCENYDYPPFTPEKQLELIKWLAGFYVHINNVGEEINISTGGGYISYYAENLADAIALCINSKWNNLTDQERTEIADILKG